MAKLENEKKREWEFLHSEENLCAIYQLKNTEVARDLRFESMKYLIKKEQEVTKRNYNLVYIAPMKEGEDLEDIYEKFNINHPKDFTGHSLSVSDVVVLNNMGGQITSHYVDSLGYKDIPEFTKEFLKEYEHITTVEDVNKVVEDFKKRTEKEFHPINGKKQKDIEQLVNEYIQEKLEEYELEVEIVDIVVSGSRCRGLERPNGSDLDIVVEYEGLEREDFLFYILNEDAFKIDDIKVDINPITEWKTGTLDTYLPDVEQYLAKVKEIQKEKEERKKGFSRSKLREKKAEIKEKEPLIKQSVKKNFGKE